MVLGAMETPSSISPNPTTNGTISPPKNKNPPQTQTQSLYRECLKNHAASIGGHALDGCGEFMPSPAAVPSDPTSFTCAACNCHRNFHRRHQNPPKTHRKTTPSPSLSLSPSPTPSPQSPPPLSHLPPNSFLSSPPPPPPAQMLLALSTGERLRFSAESSRKRFRTKFTSEQKEKMSAFADRLGWRMQRSEEKLVEQFCDEIRVRRGVLKVWMHNNKHTLGKRSVLLSAGGAANELGGGSTVNGGGEDDEDETKSGLNFFANNGSSSTS